ncbi:MAG: prohead protease/major capsid protein fusion protein [Bacteroidia bacterium]
MRSAQFLPDTFNADDNTIELIAATESEVMQRTWEGWVREVLSHENSHVRLQRLAGANVLDNHNSYGSVSKVVLGVIESAYIKDRQLHVKMRFSTREDVKPVIEDVQGGIIRNISIGYRVYSYQVTEEVGKTPEYRAIDWEPFEVSFVAVPADYNATVRSNNSEFVATQNEVTIISNSKTRNMPEEVVQTPAATATPAAAAPAANAPAETPVNAEQERSLATAAATQRSVDILSACRAANLGADYAETLIKDPAVTIDKARQMIIQKLADNQPAATRSVSVAIIGEDEQVKERKAIEYAMMSRTHPGQYQIGIANNQDSTLAANYRGISVLDAARLLLKQRGIAVEGFNKQDLYVRSMSTSDFPNLLSNIANKILRKEYEQTPQTFKALAMQQNLPDFKLSNGIQFGGDVTFDEVKEGAEFKYGSLTETVDNWKLSTYGKILKMTRQMIINDDLGAFARIARRIAVGASENESNLFWALITGNVTVGSAALFHSTHGNLAASGAVLDATSMSAARTAMRRQKGLTTKELIVVNPKYIVVAPEQEMAADQLLTNITPNTAGTVNPFTNAGLQKIVEVRLASPSWYVFAGNEIESFTYGYLEGNEGLYTEMRYGFESDGVEIKARQDFGVKAWDWRGSYKNPGA